MKLLKSQLHEQGYLWINSDLEPSYKGTKYPIKQIRVDEIWASVPKAEVHNGIVFYKPVK